MRRVYLLLLLLGACVGACRTGRTDAGRDAVDSLNERAFSFHYRNIDVSTLKELAKRWRPEVAAGFKKRQAHTALADVHESIDELLHYRQHFLRG